MTFVSINGSMRTAFAAGNLHETEVSLLSGLYNDSVAELETIQSLEESSKNNYHAHIFNAISDADDTLRLTTNQTEVDAIWPALWADVQGFVAGKLLAAHIEGNVHKLFADWEDAKTVLDNKTILTAQNKTNTHGNLSANFYSYKAQIENATTAAEMNSLGALGDIFFYRIIANAVISRLYVNFIAELTTLRNNNIITNIQFSDARDALVDIANSKVVEVGLEDSDFDPIIAAMIADSIEYYTDLKMKDLLEVILDIVDDIENLPNLSDDEKVNFINELEGILGDTRDSMLEGSTINDVITAYNAAMDPLGTIYGEALELSRINGENPTVPDIDPGPDKEVEEANPTPELPATGFEDIPVPLVSSMITLGVYLLVLGKKRRFE